MNLLHHEKYSKKLKLRIQLKTWGQFSQNYPADIWQSPKIIESVDAIRDHSEIEDIFESQFGPNSNVHFNYNKLRNFLKYWNILRNFLSC